MGYTEIGRGSGSRRLTESKATTSPRNGEKKKIKGKVRVGKKRREGEGGEKSSKNVDRNDMWENQDGEKNNHRNTVNRGSGK